MRTGRKVLTVLLIFVIVVGVLPMTASAATSGTCGAGDAGDVVWSIDKGVLTISGEGRMKTWTGESWSRSPWYENKEITKVVVEDGVTSIGSRAFMYCENIESVSIGKDVTDIGEYAFSYCDNIEEYIVSAGNPQFAAGDGILFEKGTTLVRYPSAKDDVTSFRVPAGILAVGPDAFSGNRALNVIFLPDSLEKICDYAFENCTALTSIDIPSSVVEIGYGAFDGCTSLETISGGRGVETLGTFFEDTPWVENQDFITLESPNLFKYVGNDENVVIPDGVTSIGAGAFDSCTSLASVTIPAGVASIGDRAFWGCAYLTSVTIPSSVTSIGARAFENCNSLTSVTIPKGVTSIGDRAFHYCSSLTSVTIPEGVASIGDNVFYNCDSLTSIPIPSSVTSIGESAFYTCDSLESVTMPEGVTSIGEDAFSFCDSLTSVTIPSSVTSIGAGAFNWCESLTDVYYGGSEAAWNAVSIGDYNDYLLNATIHYNSPMPEATTPTTPTETDKPAIVSELAIANTQSVLVDGEQVVFEVYALEDENGGETNYIKLRDLAFILNGTAAQFEVSWDGAVNILSGQEYTPNGSEMSTPFSGDRAYRPTDAVTKVDGTVTEFDAICLEDDDGGEYNYYKLRDLGRVLGFDVSWSAEQGIFIETDEPYTED